MKSYLSLIEINLRLAMRERVVLFFNFVFPLIFFFAFGQMMDASMGGVGVRVVSMVLVIGVLGNGLFGAGIRAVVERETNILRRYKVTPISAAPLLVASIVTGWLLYLPVIFMMLGLSHFMWGVEFPSEWPSLLILLSVGVWAMRAIGLIVASVVNSTAESNIIIQLLYMPMLFLSGATFPISMLPDWAQVLSQFLPASYLHSGMERVMIRHENIAANLTPVIALLISTMVATLIAVKIFRWEKDEVLPKTAKLWLLVVGLPFITLGVYQAYSSENIDESLALEREMRRDRTRLIRGARIFVGDGRVIDSGGILLKNGKIAEIYDGAVPAPDTLNAEAVEAAGKTVMPGLIDAHVHLGAPGGVPVNAAEIDFTNQMERALRAYLYSGVTTVKSAGDATGGVLAIRQRINRGTRQGAELLLCGPLFTTAGGYGTEHFAAVPELMRLRAEGEFLRLPATPAEARQMVKDLAAEGVDGIKAVLETGRAGAVFNRLDVAILNALAEEARAQQLPLVVHTGSAQDVADAIESGASGIEHGTFREELTGELLAALVAHGITYDPTLSVAEGFAQLASGEFSLLSRSLVEQVAPPGMIGATRAAFLASRQQTGTEEGNHSIRLEIGKENLRRAYEAGVVLVAGTDSGNPMLLHGPAIHRELQLWVEAGVPPAAALQAATYNGAKLLRSADRIGLIQPGYEANLLIVDGNPLEDISVTERISAVFFRGERIDRAGLLIKH
jgi:imidazolonepropionase-like amidohydrolase/ABC-type multidrug transport system permease subunit